MRRKDAIYLGDRNSTIVVISFRSLLNYTEIYGGIRDKPRRLLGATIKYSEALAYSHGHTRLDLELSLGGV